MKILITGGTGLLGSNLVKTLSPTHEVYAPSRKVVDIHNPILVKHIISEYNPSHDQG